ncbi:MAG: amidohydrolase [Terriglobia bacterium]
MAVQAADAVYHNGRVVTMWSKRPLAEAFAVRGNCFLRVGSNEEVLGTARRNTKKINLDGCCVVPGLIDSHAHPIMAALAEQDGFGPVHSIADIQQQIRQKAASAPAGRVICVPRVYATRLAEHRYPTRAELDTAGVDAPCMTDNGYAAVLSSALLARLGITRETPEPSNGKIIRDAAGDLAGLILGARHLVAPALNSAPHGFESAVEGLKKAQHCYNRAGLTSVIDRMAGAEEFRAYQALERRGELTVRSYLTWVVSLHGNPSGVRERIAAIPFTTGWGSDWVRVGSLKAFLDGGILIGTAYLREPYGENTGVYGYRDPQYRGILSVSPENLLEMARAANDLGWQMTAHATGGGAVDALLDAYEAADRDKSIQGRRFTISHANFPDVGAIERAKKLGVALDCQPAWHYFDAPVIEGVLGPERMQYFQPYRSLFDAGVVVAGGSDHMAGLDARAAINPFDPFFGMWMAATRQTVTGAVMEPGQRISREEALRMWTLNAAYLSFEENIKGSIEPGKLADFVITSKDYLSCPVEEIQQIKSVCTVVNGKVVYGDPALA